MSWLSKSAKKTRAGGLEMNIKKIVAGSLAALTAGATMLFAAFASPAGLGDYVKTDTNAITSPIIVIGAPATSVSPDYAKDVVGAADIAAAVAGYATKTVPGGIMSSISGEGFLFSKTANHLNIWSDNTGGEILSDIQAIIRGDHLTTTLASGTYKDNKGTNKADYSYSQRLLLGTNGAVELVRPEGATEPTTYLKFNAADVSTNPVWTYELKFKKNVKVADANDIKDTYIDILGSKYLITNAELTGGAVTSITMMTGRSGEWIAKDQTKNIEGKDVTVTLVSSVDQKCGVQVNGESAIIDKGDTHELSGVIVGVLDLVSEGYAGGAAQCYIFVGAREIKLSNGDEVLKEGNAIDGTLVTINSASNELESIEIAFAPYSDDVNLAKNQKLEDPVFGAFSFEFGGETAAISRETMKVEADGSKLKMEVTNVDGLTATFNPFYVDSSNNINLGKSDTEPLDVVEGNSLSYASSAKPMFVVEMSGSSYILQVTKVDETNDKMDFKELFSGETYKDISYNPGTSTTFDFLDYPFKLTVNEGADTITLDDITNGPYSPTAVIWTQKGAAVYLDDASDTISVIEETTIEPGVTSDKVILQVGLTPANKITISKITSDNGEVPATYEGVDKEKLITQFGTIAIRDFATDQAKVSISYPDEPIFYDAAILGADGKIVVGGAVQTAVKIQQPVAKLASEINPAALTGDLILLGGPCANSLVATLMAADNVTCDNWPYSKGIIKEYANAFGSGHKALVVAGTTGTDTRELAAKVMQGILTFSQ
jgi:hypothetical protein